MNTVSSQIKEEIRSRCDIVEVIGSYLSLKQRGKDYYALCPFHHEKTPSFVVNPNKQIFHCFGCGVGGDVFSFVAKHQNLSFFEALKVLADRCGIRLPSKQNTAHELGRLKELEQLYRINETAAKYYQQSLNKEAGAAAREYLTRRNVSKLCVEKFALGYAPPGWDQLLKHLVNQGYTPQKLLQAGLVVSRSQGGGYYDRFRQRLIFPIYNAQGRVIGFGGRALDEGQVPKYLNSPDTPLYHKGQGFYGLNWAREEIGKKGQAIIVEGYLDLITAHQYGFVNVVATLGTAITEAQVRQLRQWAKEVVIFFDSDTAGISAAVRSWSQFLKSGLRVRVVTLGTKDDPDSYLRAKGAAALTERVQQAVNLLDFVIEQSMAQSSLDRIEGKIECLNKILPVLASIPNRIERTNYLGQLAEKLHIEKGILLQELSKAVATGRQRLDKPASLKGVPLTSATELAEKMLTQLMICHPDIRQLALGQLQAEYFSSAVYCAVFKALQEVGNNVAEIETVDILNRLQEEEAKAFVCSATMGDEIFEDVQRVAADCINTLKKNRLKAKLKGLHSRIKSAGDKQALQEYEQLVKMMKMGNLPAGV
jgi:DNA primase